MGSQEGRGVEPSNSQVTPKFSHDALSFRGYLFEPKSVEYNQVSSTDAG